MNWGEWIALYMDGRCSDEQTLALQEAMKNDPALRRAYLDHLNLETALEARSAWAASPLKRFPEDDAGLEECGSFAPSDLAGAPRSEGGGRIAGVRSRARWLGAVAAVGVCFAGLGWQAVWGPAQSFATVVECAGAENVIRGSAVRRAVLRIETGMVELRTQRGARVVIEAPAEFCFESATRLRLVRGRLSADVPIPARGFTVVTASGEAVDLGTRFGVDVPEVGEAEVHVFSGEVREQSANGKRQQSVKGGEAVVMNQGAGKARELRSSAFIRREEVGLLNAALSAGQRERAAKANAFLREDPALIALLDFESGPAGPGVYREVQGRWPGSRALEFRDIGHHLQINAGGGKSWPELTLAAWVRLDRVGGGRIQSLFHTDGWDRKNPGQIHWSVTPHGTLWMVCLPFQKLAVSEENAAKLPQGERWIHVASCYDSARHVLRHYVDGALGVEITLDETAPALLGAAQIGNWDQYDRNLSGRVDELVVLGRALDGGEIAELFEAGNPYR
jgi:ferric-dicitrate binding protein FerR (iron transport regulator)